MLFTSSAFVLLVVVTFLTYYLLPGKRTQVGLLIVASFLFYAWHVPALLLLLVASVVINWLVTYGVSNTVETGRRRALATAGVVVNLGILAFFKYSPLIGRTLLPENSSAADWLVAIPLPIGISFFTFQGISLVVDTFRGQDLALPRSGAQPAGLLGKVAFYLAFFPQLIAGPIVKAHEFLPQIDRKKFRDIDWEVVYTNLVLGYFLKMVVADNLKDYTLWMDYPYFQNLYVSDLLSLLFGYSVQIFADFAGYSFIAIGLARAFGYVLPDNFSFPYVAASFSEFWRRWHISLSTFLKEYLYVPLGGNRRGRVRTYWNLMVTMTLGGLWHGAAWSYAIWGVYHGLALGLERLARDAGFRPLRNVWLRRLWVFGVVTVGWLLFRLPEFNHALLYLEKIFVNRPFGNYERTALVLAYSSPVIVYHLAYVWLNRRPHPYRTWLRPATYGLMLFLILTNAGSAAGFIYFQF